MSKNNKKNRSYTKELKESILKRLEPPTNETVSSISRELGIPKTTIYQWTKNKKSSNNKSTTKWTSGDKFQVVLETATLTETELAQYCRRKGIFIDEVKSWKEQCIKANTSTTENPQKLKTSLKVEKDKIKELEKKLRIKEKASAETAALLVLRKKANAIWGDPEDE